MKKINFVKMKTCFSKILVIALVILMINESSAKIFERCDLARKLLYTYKMPRNLLGDCKYSVFQNQYFPFIPINKVSYECVH